MPATQGGAHGGHDGGPIATTRNADLQALGTGGQLAVQAWDQLAGYLQRRFGPAHAALFAEPNPDPDRGLTDWYAAVAGAAIPIEQLAQPAQDAALAEFARLHADIRGEADTLRRSSRESERFLGELLALAVIRPSSEPVRVVGTQPVLVAWAHTRVGEQPAPEPLIGLLDRRRGVPAAGPMRILGPPPPPARNPWPARALAGLALLLPLFLLLLLWLDPFRWFVAAPQQCVVRQADLGLLHDLRAEEAREGALRAEIARIALGLGERRTACPPAAPAAPTPERRAEPPPRRADAERAREQGARSGQVQIILGWDDQNDLDLLVTCPNGDRIFFNRRQACGGELDVDRNAGGTVVSDPVENVVFGAEPPPGQYRIQVLNYRRNPPAPPASPFRVTLRREGQPDQVFTGRAGPGQPVEVGTFDIPAR